MFETDDDDFIPSQSSNLSSIFNASLTSDCILSYKAPKQPKNVNTSDVVNSRQITESKTNSQSAVLLAKVVTLWRLDNGQNKQCGKHIAAIIGNTEQERYEMIVYKEKTNILIRHFLSNNLILYKYPNNFIGVFDEQKQFWNLNFGSVQCLEDFSNLMFSFKCQIIDKRSQTDSSNADVVCDNKNNANSPSPISESDDHEKMNKINLDEPVPRSKSKLLSKISKMGQRIIPNNPLENKSSSGLSESETESSSSVPKPIIVPRRLNRKHNQEKNDFSSTSAENKVVSTYPSNYDIANNNQMILNSQHMIHPQSYSSYGINSVLLSQNAEIKANLAEINFKLGSVLNHEDRTEDSNDGNSRLCDKLKSQIKCLKLKIENLTSDLDSTRQLYEDLKLKYSDATKTEKDEDINQVLAEYEEQLKRAERLQMENVEVNRNLKEKDDLIGSQQQRITELEAFQLEKDKFKELWAEEKQELMSKIDELTMKLNKEAENNQNISKSTEQNLLDKEEKIKIIKESMNNAFLDIMDNFNKNDLYNCNQIKSILLNNLKKATISIINNLY